MNKNAMAGLLLLWALPAAAEPVSLAQVVDEALGRGPDQIVLAAGLDGSRATAAQAAARAGFTLSTGGGWSASQTVNTPAAASSALTAPPTVGAANADGLLPQSANASVTLASPLTSFGVKGTQTFVTGSDGKLVQATEATASVSQVIWNGYPGGPLQAAAEKAALALKSAELTAQANRNKLVMTVKSAYFTLLSAQEARNQLSLARDQRTASLTFVKTRFSLGQATGLDLKQAEVNLKTAQLDLTAGQAAWEAARSRLANLMGRASAEGLEAAAEPQPVIEVSTVEEAVARALDKRIEPRAAQAAARSAEIDALSAFGSVLPSVSVAGSATYRTNPQTDKSSVTGLLTVTLTQPVWDGGLAGAQGALADAQRRTAQTQYNQLLQSIPVDVAEGWNNWQTALGRLETAQGSVEIAQGQSLVVQTQFEAGLKTISDQQTAEVTLSTAQLNLVKAKIAAQQAAITLQNLMGQ